MLFLTITLTFLVFSNAQIVPTTISIQQGDTYCAIAQKYGCPDWTILQTINKYDPRSLRIGDPMQIPGYPYCTGTSSCTYIYLQSDTTYLNLAASNGVDSNCLNKINCDAPLTAGSRVCIPSTCKIASATPPPAYSIQSTINVQSGDTYCEIAQKYGCPDWTILQTINKYDPSSLRIGDPMQIPGNPYCTGSPSCTYIYLQSDTTYPNLASTYGIDSNCLNKTNCNRQLTAGSRVCISNFCQSSTTTPAPTTPANGLGPNGVFYCYGQATTVSVAPNPPQYCGGAYYSNGQLANGYIGSTFYCNGQIVSDVSDFTCGNKRYINGNPVTGVVGSTFYCNGVPAYNLGGNSRTIYNCGGVNYNQGVIANGWMPDGQFYCSGQPTTVLPNSGLFCSGKYYVGGSPYTGNYNGQFYCDGVPTPSRTGYCSGKYYQNGLVLYNCDQIKSVSTVTSCANYANQNGISVQQLTSCNPSLDPTNCYLQPQTAYNV